LGPKAIHNGQRNINKKEEQADKIFQKLYKQADKQKVEKEYHHAK
jgi:hypothetical protein